jgi:ComF family protein
MPRYYYNTVLRAAITTFFDLLIPPRPTERVVRALTVEELHALGGEESLPYHDPRVTALIWELKYYGSAQAATLSGSYLGEQLLALAAEELGVPLLIPIPMHPNRRHERGHNHTEALCKATLPFAAGALEYAGTVLRRVVDTPTQQGLPKAERLRNVQGSMTADPHTVSGRACIVVDDVTTTGATLAEAKRALLLSGARVVHTIALARS